MTNLVILLVIFLLAFLIEALIEYFLGIPMSRIPKLAPYSWTLIYVAAIVGIVGAFIYQLDLVSIISIYLGGGIPIHPFGIILTGLAIGRGANFVHDLVMKFAKPVFVEPTPATSE